MELEFLTPINLVPLQNRPEQLDAKNVPQVSAFFAVSSS